MNFKKIEIAGFKSFADKTTIEFNDGITGIVGPNGCGKSNVADAIRWVLGEQSPKLLRGKNMQDVIFKGTMRRSELSVCEVTLFFDNSKKIFPNVPYEEIAIGRKLYKSGESEYLLNGAECRLKDVQDLIRDTGLGREGYSIVGQGRVDEIVNAKPKDRRGIFEDAAGVLKYKIRKLDAERKLDRAKENIDRLEDIMSEIKRRLGPLEKQSEDATKFFKIRDELRVLELNEYIYKCDNNDMQEKELKEKFNAIAKEYAAKSKEFERANIDYSGKNIELNNVDAYIGNLRDEQTAMAVKAENIKGQGSTLNERISQLKEQKNNFNTQLLEFETQLDEKTNVLQDYTNKHSMQSEERDEALKEYNNLSDKYIKMADDILKREHIIEQKNMEMQKALEDMGDIKADLGMLVARRENANLRCSELEEEIKKFKALIDADDALRVELEREENRLKSEKSTLASNKNQVLFELNKQKKVVEESREELSRVNGKITSLQMRLKILQDFKNDYEAFGGAVKKLMQAAKQNAKIGGAVLGVVADIVRTSKEYEVCIETALGGNISNVVTKNENDAKDLIEFLKQNRFGRITFLPITSFKARELDDNLKGALKEKGCVGLASKLVSYDKKFENIVIGLLGRTVVCEDMDSSIAISRKYNYNLKIVTLQGDVINPSGSITGGSRKAESSNALSQDREIEDAQAELTKAQGQFDSLKSKIASGGKEVEEMTCQLAEYEENVKFAEIAYATQVGKIDKVNSRLAQLLADMHSRAEAVKELDITKQAIETAIGQIDAQGESVKDNRRNVNSETAQNKIEFDEKKLQREELNKQMQNAQARLSTVETELVAIDEFINKYTAETELLSNNIISCRRSIKALEDKIYSTENNLNTAVVTKEDKQKYEELIAKIATLDIYKKKLNQEIAELVAKKDELAQQMQDVNEQKVKQQGQIEKLEEGMKALQEHIAEEYEITYNDALPFKVEDFNITGVATQIAKLRKAKFALGGVNVEAIEQFRDESERYAAMSKDRDDLVDTANDCLQIIDEMSKEMKTRFESAFEIINKNFQMVFKELFGGGEGKLVIEKPEEGEDPLSAGIEIYVTPPGKSLKSITLFSGGEKAFIAIAILFAILKMKAMPFCVLDEIEAALDDTNVGLFAKYLGRFSRETQFIVITHRKPTMELADRLYGVTMQEKGVSKVVTVSLTDAVEM